MIITFQLQVDPLIFYDNTWESNPTKKFSKTQLKTLKQEFEKFYSFISSYTNEFVRGEMYVDNEVYLG